MVDQRRPVLILGNGPSINDINFDRLRPDVITVGVNRIFHVHIPDYFFFHDLEIATELHRRPKVLQELRENSVIFSSDWIKRRSMQAKKPVPRWARIHPRPDQRQFPDSVSTCMQILTKHYLNKQQHTFYIAGVSLRWQDPSHFWKGTAKTHNNKGKDWYEPRFARMAQNFRKNIHSKNYNVYSVTPGSRLNKTFRYIKIENLYQ